MATRGDVTAVVLDSDDNVDFDGPPSGPNRLTPMNVDDTTFVTSITTVSTPETLASCTQIQANQYVGCTTGTPVTFNVNIQTPATHSSSLSRPGLHLRRPDPRQRHQSAQRYAVRGGGPRALALSRDAWFVRDFDTTNVCPLGTAPVWGTWAWMRPPRSIRGSTSMFRSRRPLQGFPRQAIRSTRCFSRALPCPWWARPSALSRSNGGIVRSWVRPTSIGPWRIPPLPRQRGR